jgi:septal ring-binding cell division protein DamX
MKKMEQLYRTAPRRQSPEALDQRILRHAELQASRNSRTAEKSRARSSAWMPLAATAVVALLSVTLVLRNPGQDMGNLSVDAETGGISNIVANEPASELADQALATGVEMQIDDAGDDSVSSAEDGSVSGARQESAELPVSSVPQDSVSANSALEKRAAQADEISEETQTITARPVIEAVTIAESESDTVVPIVDQPQSVATESTDSALVAELPRSAQPSGVRQERIRSQVTQAGQMQAESQVQTDTQNPLPVQQPRDQALDQARDQARGQVQPEASEVSRGGIPAPVRSHSASNKMATELALAADVATESEMVSRSTAAVESNSRRDAIILIGQGAVDWLNNHPESHYLLQLASADEENYLLEFADSLSAGLPVGQIAVVKVRPSSYTLLVGGFASFSDAETALTNLSENARRFGARVRNAALLQQSLR